MYFRKRTKINIAYAVLAAGAFTAIAHDAELRSAVTMEAAQIRRAGQRAPAPPLQMTPIAESPFPEARPSRALVYYLTVAVQVDCGNGPVAFNRGTRVHFVRQEAERILVTRDGAEFFVQKSQLTDDANALVALARNSS